MPLATKELDILANFELPSLPRAALNVISLVQDPDVDLQSLSKAIEVDPALASRIVRLANSSLFGLSREISSVRQAMVILGLRTVKIAALSFTLMPALPSKKGDAKLLATCWQRILTNAMACRMLAKLFHIDMEEAFLAGLMQDVGVMVFANTDSEKYFGVLNAAFKEDGPPLTQLEVQTFGLHHAEIGSRLLEKWSLPVTLVHSVSRHHDVSLSGELERHREDMPVLLSVAETVTDFLLNPTMKNLDAFTNISVHFGESSSEVDQFVQRLEIQVNEMAEMLELELPTGESYEQVLQRAREVSKSLRILHRDALPLRIRQELAMAKRQHWAVSVLLIQIRQASLEGASPAEKGAMVDTVAVALQELTRDCDSLYRLSSDVFALLAPNTPSEGAAAIVQRMLPKVKQSTVSINGKALGAEIIVAAVSIAPSDNLIDSDDILKEAVANLRKAYSTQRYTSSIL